MNQNSMTELQSFLTEKSISPEDQQFWLLRFEHANDAMRASIFDLFREFPVHIGWLRMMQEKKEAAIASGDMGSWKQIVGAEKDYLQALSVPYN